MIRISNYGHLPYELSIGLYLPQDLQPFTRDNFEQEMFLNQLMKNIFITGAAIEIGIIKDCNVFQIYNNVDFQVLLIQVEFIQEAE